MSDGNAVEIFECGRQAFPAIDRPKHQVEQELSRPCRFRQGAQANQDSGSNDSTQIGYP